MDNMLMISLQTQRVLQRRLDTAANNLANMNTTGFKADTLVTHLHTENPARSEEKPHDIRFVRDVALARDMGQGAITRTGNPLDVALEGAGFFTVQGPSGLAYTRDGAFQTSAAGQLQTKDGFSVLNAQGRPIVFDAQGGEISIGADGQIRIGEAVVGQLGIATFPRPGSLEKVGDNLFTASGQAPGAFEGRLVQGALETSNVRPVVELTRLMEISRAYESAARMVRQGDELRQRAVDRLGRT
jgi:flagellar basal-body rod protein FlgF